MNGNGVVLIVDDHAPLASSLISLFSAAGFNAQAVHSGAEALAFLHNHTVALVLLDMSLPDMSGADVLRAIRVPGSGPFHSVPVVVFSADDHQAIRDELTKLGATDLVSKTNPSGLLRIVSAHLRPANPPPA